MEWESDARSGKWEVDYTGHHLFLIIEGLLLS